MVLGKLVSYLYIKLYYYFIYCIKILDLIKCLEIKIKIIMYQ